MRYLAVAVAVLLVGSWTRGADDFVSLFNGKDLEGWEQKGGKAKYTVEDGVIVGSSVPDTSNSFLCTKKHFKNFVLEFEFKGHPSLNSGVQIRSNSMTEQRDGRVHGYQCELEDEGNARDWSCGIYDEGRRGWLYPNKSDKELSAGFSAAGRKAWKDGDWNLVKIEANGESIRTWLNGVPRADLKDDLTASGFIGLQVHGVGGRQEPLSVRWRNIKIKELP